MSVAPSSAKMLAQRMLANLALQQQHGANFAALSLPVAARKLHTGKPRSAASRASSPTAARRIFTAVKPSEMEEMASQLEEEIPEQRKKGFLSDTIYTPQTKDVEREFFHDFKYKITRPDLRQVTHPLFKDVLGRESDKPLVCVFGWAGANDKNLAKYAEVYQAAGCDTLAYYLPTRFIFNQTDDVPYLAVELLRGLEREGLLHRPVFYHMLSDTGIMTHQGVRAVLRESGLELDTRGAVMDSCPGPIPRATVPRVSALLVVQWICAVRDQKGLKGSTQEVLKTAKRVWPNLVRRMQGLPAQINYVDGVWSGDFLRADAFVSRHPELFLYSKKDFYLPLKYMEEVVLPERRAAGRLFETKCFEKSGHVSHLRSHRRDYADAVHGFVDRHYFQQFK